MRNRDKANCAMFMYPTEARDRAKGALWGLVVGDCLGSPIQFSGKDDHPLITEMVECPVFKLPPGY